MSSINDVKKSQRGRPRVDSEPITVRIERPLLQSLDAWIAEQPEQRLSRPEAIRLLIGLGIAASIPRNSE